MTPSLCLSSCEWDLSPALDTAVRKRMRKLKQGNNPFQQAKSTLCPILYYSGAGKSGYFVHQVFYKSCSHSPSSSRRHHDEVVQDSSARCFLGTSCFYSLAALFQTCFRTMYSCSCCSTASAQRTVGGEADSEGTYLDREAGGGGDGGAGEGTPLLKEGGAPGRYASAAWTSGGPMVAAGAQEQKEANDQENQPHLMPNATLTGAAAKKRKRKKRPTMYQSILEAAGLPSYEVVEHAAELPLFQNVANRSPAGKVST